MIKNIKNSLYLGAFSIHKAIAQTNTGGGTQPGGGGTQPSGQRLTNPLRYGTLEEILGGIANFLFAISIPLVVIMIIIGAFYLIAAGGNDQRVTTGKNIIKWAVIGFVVILLAGSVAGLIKNLLEG